MAPTSAQQTTVMTENEMQRVISGVSSSRAHTDPSACILTLDPLLRTKEGRRFLLKQVGDKALILIELLDWALKSHENPLNLNKGYILWTLRQLCASQETLPESCILPIEFKTSDPHHAAGGFADVWKGTYEGRDMAFKTLRRSTQVDDATRLKRKRRFCKEVILWKSLDHPNILGLVGVCRWDDTPEARLTMVSQWMPNGNITEYTKNNESQRMQLLIDCARGVQHIHRTGLVHGDLKGANILITSDNPVRACLADFGFTTIVSDEANGPGGTSALGGGTVPFMAPELLCPSQFGRTKCQVSKEADVYAFGMVILQVLTSLMPFHTFQHTEISYKVIQGERPARPSNAEDSGISNDLWQLLEKCWYADSTKRPPIEEVLQHLSNDLARGKVFPPSKIPPAPSCESVLESGTQKYGEVFVTANPQTPVEDYPPFTLPTSPVDSEEYPSSGTQNPASLLFSVGPQDSSTVTSPGNSQIRSEEQKLHESETPSPASNISGSTTIIANSADDLRTSGRARYQGAVINPLHRGPVLPQYDYDGPTIYDTSHVDLTQVPAQGPSRPPPFSDPLGVKPRLQITTVAPVTSRNSNSPGTAFYTPGGSGEVVERRPFDSAAAIRVIYSSSGSRPRDSVGPFRRVVDVLQQGSNKYSFPIQRTPVSPSNPKATGAPSRYGFRKSLQPSRNSASSPRYISGAGASIIPGHEFELQPRSRLTGPDEREDVGTSRDTSIFPRKNGKRVMPSWEGTAETQRTKEGQERDDCSHISNSTDYVSVSGESARDKTPTPRASSESSPFRYVLRKLGFRKLSQPQNRVQPEAQTDPSSASMSTATIESFDTPVADSAQGRGRERKFSVFQAFLTGSVMKKKGSRRDMRFPLR